MSWFGEPLVQVITPHVPIAVSKIDDERRTSYPTTRSSQLWIGPRRSIVLFECLPNRIHLPIELLNGQFSLSRKVLSTFRWFGLCRGLLGEGWRLAPIFLGDHCPPKFRRVEWAVLDLAWCLESHGLWNCSGKRSLEVLSILEDDCFFLCSKCCIGLKMFRIWVLEEFHSWGSQASRFIFCFLWRKNEHFGVHVCSLGPWCQPYKTCLVAG